VDLEDAPYQPVRQERPAGGVAARGTFGFHEPGVLEGLAAEAGLEPEQAGELAVTLAFAAA
jgi:hypothetical protein